MKNTDQKNCKTCRRKCNNYCSNDESDYFLKVVSNAWCCDSWEKQETIAEILGEVGLLEELNNASYILGRDTFELSECLRTGESLSGKSADYCYEKLKKSLSHILLCVDEYFDSQGNDYTHEIFTFKEEDRVSWLEKLERGGE